MTTQKEFQAAYRAWRAARDAYDQDMRDAMHGGPADWAEMRHKIEELERLHTEWTEKSKPFVRWKGAPT